MPLTFGGDNDRSCKSTSKSPSRSKLEAHLECMNEAMKRRGDVPAQAINPEGLKGAMQMTGNGGGPLGEEVLHAGESPFLPDAQRSEPAFPPAAH